MSRTDFLRIACLIFGLTGAAHAQDTTAPTIETRGPVLSQPGPATGPVTVEDTTETVPAVTEAAASPEATGPVETGLPHDLSPWGMFMAADNVVKSVMIGLALASLATWTVWIAKSLELMISRRRLKRDLRVILGVEDLKSARIRLSNHRGAAAQMIETAFAETAMSLEALRDSDGQGLTARITSHLGRIEARAGRRLTFGTGLLATIGAISPFVGLFGTVWGIMNAFIGISESQTTNLAVVAPGIAEALLATALGLVAAIPAVVIYNAFARSIAGYRALLADAAAGVERLISRDLDHRRLTAQVHFLAAE